MNSLSKTHSRQQQKKFRKLLGSLFYLPLKRPSLLVKTQISDNSTNPSYLFVSTHIKDAKTRVTRDRARYAFYLQSIEEKVKHHIQQSNRLRLRSPLLSDQFSTEILIQVRSLCLEPLVKRPPLVSDCDHERFSCVFNLP